MTLQDVLNNKNKQVIYRPYPNCSKDKEKQGEIMRISGTNAVVKFKGDWYTTIVDPADLTLA